MIKLQVIGNLGKDCVQKEVNGKNVINFNVANTEKFKGSDGSLQERTTWVECAYWTDRTGIAPYLLKGKLVFVEGTPEATAYKRNDGEPAASLRLKVREVQLLGGRSDSDQSDASAPGASQSTASPVVHESGADDLPF